MDTGDGLETNGRSLVVRKLFSELFDQQSLNPCADRLRFTCCGRRFLEIELERECVDGHVLYTSKVHMEGKTIAKPGS